eukprot:3381089-Pleurochrysis_carterae.AAC.1
MPTTIANSAAAAFSTSERAKRRPRCLAASGPPSLPRGATAVGGDEGRQGVSVDSGGEGGADGGAALARSASSVRRAVRLAPPPAMCIQGLKRVHCAFCIGQSHSLFGCEVGVALDDLRRDGTSASVVPAKAWRANGRRVIEQHRA